MAWSGESKEPSPFALDRDGGSPIRFQSGLLDACPSIWNRAVAAVLAVGFISEGPQGLRLDDQAPAEHTDQVCGDVEWARSDWIS